MIPIRRRANTGSHRPKVDSGELFEVQDQQRCVIAAAE
jgi:hypothetical protein